MRLAEDEQRLYFDYVTQGRARPLAPSRLFPTLKPALDDRIMREGQARNVPLLRALAAVPADDQREFYERALGDLAAAQRWAALPRWQRPIMTGDRDDQIIWKFFMVYRLRMEAHLRAGDTPAGVGQEMIALAAMLTSLTDHRRLAEVIHRYGAALSHGQELGARSTPPWAK
jgi:hypothetical protein